MDRGKTVRLFVVILYRRGGKTQLWCESWAGWMLAEVGLAEWGVGGPRPQKAIAMALTFRIAPSQRSRALPHGRCPGGYLKRPGVPLALLLASLWVSSSGSAT